MAGAGAEPAPFTSGRSGALGRIDRLGVIIALIALYGLLGSPFSTFKANRIVLGEARSVFAALPPWAAGLLVAVVLVASLIAILRTTPLLKLGAALFTLLALGAAIGLAANFLTPEGNSYARAAPASGFWLLLFAFSLLIADALTRLKLNPWLRIGALAVAAAIAAFFLVSGAWSSLSIMKEYATRADAFGNEFWRHIVLALGSLAAAVIVGIPLGVLCHRTSSLRHAVLNGLNIIQTIPSIALFGMLIAPLSWVAANVPGASALGIRGIGVAPAFVALFLYSLLPVVANTVVGLGGVSPQVNDAARGVGMTDRQRLFGVEFPLAFPVILTGIRIVLVQNIGLATIAALIGGGGLGVFVFQGIGQTAMDLVLLGAVPTVALAFASAVVLDSIIELIGKRGVETA